MFASRGSIASPVLSRALILLLAVFIFTSMFFFGQREVSKSHLEADVSRSIDLASSAGYESQPQYEWKFVRYEPSKFEKRWHDLIKADPTGEHLCQLLHSGGDLTAQTYALYNTTVMLGKMQHEASSSSTYAHFSQMVYQLYRNGKPVKKFGYHLIEPLYGILRDPCDFFCNAGFAMVSEFVARMD